MYQMSTRTVLILPSLMILALLLGSGPASASTTTIDVLFAYTENALSLHPFYGDADELESRVLSKLNQMHATYAEENINIQIELQPHFYQTDWDDEASHTMASMRIMLRNPDDGRLDDVLQARDDADADLVVLFIRNTTTVGNVLGVAYTNGELGLTSIPDQPVLEDYAFAVVRSTSLGTFNHELQHLMGVNHDKTDDPELYAPIFNANAETVAGFRVPETTWDVCSAGCPYTDLQLAISSAPAGAVLRVGPGDYPGGLSLDKDLTLRGAGVTRTRIDGHGANNVVSVHASDVTLAHLTVTGGDGTTGSGIFNSGGLYLEEVVVKGNTGPYGGAVLNLGTLEIVRSQVSHNTFSYAGGFGGGVTNYTTLSLQDTRIENNRGYLGGGLHNSGGTTEGAGGKLAYNTAVSLGGGYSNHNIGGTVSLSGVELRGNHSETSQYQQCYDLAEPELCPARTPREACIDACSAELDSCRYECDFTCSDECYEVFLACIDDCPLS